MRSNLARAPKVRNAAGAVDLSDIARRMERVAVAGGYEKAEGTDTVVANAPRWRIDERWVEFECGCRAERCLTLVSPAMFDPIIFRNLGQQAVYEGTCDFHAPSMNVYVHFGGFADFKQWKANRRAVLMGRVRP